MMDVEFEVDVVVADLVERLRSQYLLSNTTEAPSAPSPSPRSRSPSQVMGIQRRTRDRGLPDGLPDTEDHDSGMASDEDSPVVSSNIQFTNLTSHSPTTESCRVYPNISGSFRSTCNHRCSTELGPDARTSTLTSSSVDMPPAVSLPVHAALSRPLPTEYHAQLYDISNGNDMVVTSSCSHVCGRIDSCFQRYCSTNAHKVDYAHDNRCDDDIDDEVEDIFSLQDTSTCAATSSCRRSECSYADIVTFKSSSPRSPSINQQRLEVGRLCHIGLSSTQRPSLNLYKMRKMRIRRKYVRKMSLLQHKLRPPSVAISSSNVHQYLTKRQETLPVAVDNAPAYCFRSLTLFSVV